MCKGHRPNSLFLFFDGWQLCSHFHQFLHSVVQTAFGDLGVRQQCQIRQTHIGVCNAQHSRLLQSLGQFENAHLLLQTLNGIQLLLGRRNHLVRIGKVTVQLAVNRVAHGLFNLGIENAHTRIGGTHGAQQVGNGIGTLKVQHMVAAAHGFLWGKSQLQQQCIGLTAHIVVGGGQFHVVALFGVGNAAPCQKRTAHKAHTAAGFFQHCQIHMVHRGVIDFRAEGIVNLGQLLPIGDLQHTLAPISAVGNAVKFQMEGLLEQLGQACGKFTTGSNKFNFIGSEGVAIQQGAVALRHSAAAGSHRLLAQFLFYIR